jgi:hypothetical protein
MVVQMAEGVGYRVAMGVQIHTVGQWESNGKLMWVHGYAVAAPEPRVQEVETELVSDEDGVALTHEDCRDFMPLSVQPIDLLEGWYARRRLILRLPDNADASLKYAGARIRVADTWIAVVTSHPPWRVTVPLWATYVDVDLGLQSFVRVHIAKRGKLYMARSVRLR